MDSKDKPKGFESWSPERQIQFVIQYHAGVLGLKRNKYGEGTVKSVDEPNRQCAVDVTLGEFPDLMEEVNLMASNGDGFIRIPTIGSVVQFESTPNNETFIRMFSDLDAVVIWLSATNQVRIDSKGYIINDGLNGGVINITALTSSLNTLIANMNTNYTAIAASIAALSGAFVPVPAIPVSQTAYEDLNFKH